MDSLKSEHYEFLDLTEVDDSERNRLNESLFGSPPPEYSIQLPWTPVNIPHGAVPPHADVYSQRWQEHYGDNEQSIGGDRSPSSCVTSDSSGIMSPHSGVGVPPPNMYAQQPTPVMYSVQQSGSGYPHHPHNVIVNNVTANVNLHGYMPNPQFIPQHQAYPVASAHVQTEGDVSRNSGNNRVRNRPRNVSRHRPNEIEQSVRMNSNTQYMQPQYMPIPQYAPTYYTPTVHPGAQHPSGSPMYLAYPQIYGGYPPQANTILYPPGMHMSPAEYPFAEPQLQHNMAEISQENMHPAFQHGLPNADVPQPQPPVFATVIVNNKTDGQKSANRKQTPNKPPFAQVEIKQTIPPELSENQKAPVPVALPPVSEPAINSAVNKIATNGETKDAVKNVHQSNEHFVKPKNIIPISVNNNNAPTEHIQPAVEITKTLITKTHSTSGKCVFNTRKPNDISNLETVRNMTHRIKPEIIPLKQESVQPVVQTPNKIIPGKQESSPVVSAPVKTVPAGVNEVKLNDLPKATVPNIKPTNKSQEHGQVNDLETEIRTVFTNVMNNEKTNGFDKNHTEPLQNSRLTKAGMNEPVSPVLPPQKTEETTTIGKSWASLFTKQERSAQPLSSPEVVKSTPVVSNAKPLARVSPFGTEQAPNNKPPAFTPPSVITKTQKPVTCGFLDDPNSYRMGEFLVKYVIDNKTVSLLPRGFINRSNYCYVNSILQALMACPPFYNLIRALPQQFRNGKEKSSTPVINSIIDLVNEFEPLPPGSRVSRREKTSTPAGGNQVPRAEGLDMFSCGNVLEPSCIYQSLHAVRSDSFSVEGRQEDAEEFLGCFLNSLNDEMLELIKLVDDGSTDPAVVNGAPANTTGSQAEDEWKVMGPKNKGSITRRMEFGRSPISDIFRGQLRCRVQRAGDQSTDNVQPFFTLQLDIEKANSVKEALEMFVGRDRLEGVTCSRTQQAVEAWQQVSLEELPLVLLLHLKCFHYERDTCSKIIKTVEFPVDLKIDPKLMSTNKKYTNKQKQYKLFAVVYHDGKEATKGHYITDAFHVGYGGWVRYDDSSVRVVTESQVLRPRAPRMPYLLYYRRCDTIGSHGVQSPNTKKE